MRTSKSIAPMLYEAQDSITQFTIEDQVLPQKTTQEFTFRGEQEKLTLSDMLGAKIKAKIIAKSVKEFPTENS